MSDRLKEVLEDFFIVNGKTAGIGMIADTVKRSVRTVERWVSLGISDPHSRYKLALACGCSDEEARAIAKASFSHRARETA